MVDKKQIEDIFLEDFKCQDLKKVIVHDDGSLTVHAQNITFSKRLPRLRVKFREIIDVDFFDISMSGLESLEGCPEKIPLNIVADHNDLTDLVGGPKEVLGTFNLAKNKLTNLLHSPVKVDELIVYDNPLESLEGFPSEIQAIYLDNNPTLPLLRTLVCKKEVNIIDAQTGEFLEHDAMAVLNDPRWLGKGKLGAIPCAAALIKAGFGGNAKW
jgi:hypothetical protein